MGGDWGGDLWWKTSVTTTWCNDYPRSLSYKRRGVILEGKVLPICVVIFLGFYPVYLGRKGEAFARVGSPCAPDQRLSSVCVVCKCWARSPVFLAQGCLYTLFALIYSLALLCPDSLSVFSMMIYHRVVPTFASHLLCPGRNRSSLLYFVSLFVA